MRGIPESRLGAPEPLASLERNQSPRGLVSFVQGCRSLAVQVNLGAEASRTVDSGFAIDAEIEAAQQLIRGDRRGIHSRHGGAAIAKGDPPALPGRQ